MKWLEYQFLDAPFQNLCDLELVFGGAGDLVDVALTEFLLFAKFSEPVAYDHSGGIIPPRRLEGK
jgi:hypothetical protein